MHMQSQKLIGAFKCAVGVVEFSLHFVTPQFNSKNMCASLERSDWFTDHRSLRERWSCALAMPGALLAIIPGMRTMLRWFVANLAT